MQELDTMYAYTPFWSRPGRQLVALLFAVLMPLLDASAQAVYGVGDATTTNCGGTVNSVFTVSATTGVATSVGTLSVQTAAVAVSPFNGLIYYFEINVANPRLYSWNPTGGVNTLLGTSTIPLSPTNAGVIRMAFAPDGRLYAATNTNLIYEVNPSNGATIRTITTNITQGGSGDFAFASNGDMYVVANDTIVGNPYQLWRLTAAQIAAGGTVTATTIGANLGISNTIAPNGLAEIPPTGSCAASPCFEMTTGPSNQTYLVNGATGAATLMGATGSCLADLGRGYNTNFTLTKSDTRSTVQSGDTVTYSIVLTNTGPAGVPQMTIQDPGVAGLTCTSVSCASAGGAVCPGTLTIAALQGAGLVTGSMPNASSVTLSVTCSVN